MHECCQIRNGVECDTLMILQIPRVDSLVINVLTGSMYATKGGVCSDLAHFIKSDLSRVI